MTADVLDPRTAHAKALDGEIVLVDIRTPQEWADTGIPASAYAVTMNQDPQTLLGILSTLLDGDPSKPLALICRSGNRSANLANQLRGVGFSHVIDVAEGVEGGRFGPGWLNAALPVRPGADAGQPPRLGAGASRGSHS